MLEEIELDIKRRNKLRGLRLSKLFRKESLENYKDKDTLREETPKLHVAKSLNRFNKTAYLKYITRARNKRNYLMTEREGNKIHGKDFFNNIFKDINSQGGGGYPSFQKSPQKRKNKLPTLSSPLEKFSNGPKTFYKSGGGGYGNNSMDRNGFNSYLKIRANKEMLRKNKKLLEETLRRLSLPKFKKTVLYNKIAKNEKDDDNDNNNFFEMLDFDIPQEQLKGIIEDNNYIKGKNNFNCKKKKSLFEKAKEKDKVNEIKTLHRKYKELEICEKKFDVVIGKTLEMLNNDFKKLLMKK